MFEISATFALLPSELPTLARRLAFGDSGQSATRGDDGYMLIDRVAVLPIMGILFHDDEFFGTSYDRIRASFRAALTNPEVKAIVLLVDSPGGEAAGCFDLADEIYSARATKPIVAILDESAYSAAYALASAAEVITVPRTGGTGSIGTAAMHMDMTRALEDAGIKITTVQYGARKSETYPTSTLSDEARGRMQADVDVLGEMFVDLVARNRGMSAERVRNTEAGTFLGVASVDTGLADVVASPQEAFRALLGG